METRERKNAINAAYYARHRERLAAEETIRRRLRTPEENRRRSLADRETPRKFLVGIAAVAKQRAARKGMAYEISRDYLFGVYQEQEGLCALTKDSMTCIVGQGRVRTNISVDRIDPDLGYVPGNVQLVCDGVNTAKGNLTQEAFLDMCRKVLG